MKKIKKALCLLFILCASFCFSMINSYSSKAEMVNPPLIPGEGGSSGGNSNGETTCTDSTYYELNSFDPTISEDDVRRSDTFIMNEMNLNYYLNGKELTEENLLNRLKYEFYFYEVTVNCDDDPIYSYDILGSDWDYYLKDMWWENLDSWYPSKLGKYKFEMWLDYKNNFYYTTFYLEFSEKDELLSLTGPSVATAYITEKLDLEKYKEKLTISCSSNNYRLYIDFDSYSENYQKPGIYYVFYVLENLDTYDAVSHRVEIKVIDNIPPIFNDELNEVIVSNTVVLKPQALYNFLDLVDNIDSRDKLEIQVVKNTYEYASLELGEYEFVLIAKDSAGNFSEEKKIKVIVVDDILLPVAITNTNIVLSNSFLEADALAHAVAYVNGFSSRPYSYKLDNEDYIITQSSHEVTDRASQVDVEFTFEDDSKIEKSLSFKTVSENYLSNNVNAEKYNSAGSKFIRFLIMLWDMLLWLLEKLFGWLI